MQTINAETQYQLSAMDMQVILALARAGTIAGAGARLNVDASTVFRVLQRIEKGLGQRLFERSRKGCVPLDMAAQVALHAEHIETQVEAARALLQSQPDEVAGTVRLTTTDTILHGLLAPALKPLAVLHPKLGFELHTGNELANLTQRDADIAVRVTKRPPPHVVGKHVGPIRVALFGATDGAPTQFDPDRAGSLAWIAPDDAMPEHPSVVWRRRHFPRVAPRYRVNSILTVAEFTAMGLGVGVLPLFLAQARPDLRQLSPVLDECQTELWLLTHTESRYLRRIATVFSHLAQHLQLR